MQFGIRSRRWKNIAPQAVQHATGPHQISPRVAMSENACRVCKMEMRRAISMVTKNRNGILETLNLIGDKLELKGSLWEAIGAINDNFGIFGYLIIGVFLATWAISALFYRLMGYDRLEPLPARSEKEVQS